MKKTISLSEPGGFCVGANYWASHAGTAMWSDWNGKIIEDDLRQLASEGLQILRVFPMWSDFQPLKRIYGFGGSLRDLQFGEEELPHTEAGIAGISQEAMEHFRNLLDLAGKYGLTLIVGLLTGWMSGRLFVPPAFEGRNVLTDPLVRKWQIRFVRHFVKTFKEHPAVFAWDLGNECNCMQGILTQEEAWLFTEGISAAIRLEDKSHPVISGMHGLNPSSKSVWRIQDQGELTDILTTHPYPIATPFCALDPIDTMRNGLHATAESRIYADIGGKPCIAEELGTIGPMYCDERTTAYYIRSTLFSLWANDCRAMLWWCAFDQDLLGQQPYASNAYERELGLIGNNRKTKPALKEIGKFIRTIDGFGINLPPRKPDAVCILTEGQDQWAAGFGAFILAKQAGFDLEFQFSDQPLKDSRLYIVPCINGAEHMHKSFQDNLLERIKGGATLYLSQENFFMTHFSKIFGAEVVKREMRDGECVFRLGEGNDKCEMSVDSPLRFTLRSLTAEVLAREVDGNPVFLRNSFGKGVTFFSSVPLESHMCRKKGAFIHENEQCAHKIYGIFASRIISDRLTAKRHPFTGVTEHRLHKDEAVIVIVNYSPGEICESLKLRTGWEIAETMYGRRIGSPEKIGIPGNDAVVIRICRKTGRSEKR